MGGREMTLDRQGKVTDVKQEKGNYYFDVEIGPE